jgi:tetratricopeptide (TPR) repeat protein
MHYRGKWMSPSLQNCESAFEIAKLHFARCDFDSAELLLKKSLPVMLSDKNYRLYLDSQNILLRISAEREDFETVSRIKEELQDLILEENLDLNSRTYYVLGISSKYRQQDEAALDYFQRALAIALAADHKEDLCFAIAGIAIVYASMNRLSDALREIYNLEVFFGVLDLPDVKLSTQILNGFILTKLERYDQALEVLRGCFETLKVLKNHYMYLHLLYVMGFAHQSMGEIDVAKFYFGLAQASIDQKNLRTLAFDVNARLLELGGSKESSYDLVFDVREKIVLENRRGKIDFRNQFILLDLLHMFLKTPGSVYSKEQIAQKLWTQEYNPDLHDNKIYVTIKRLRKMIEPDFDKPKYIFRGKNGYYLNKAARILIQ